MKKIIYYLVFIFLAIFLLFGIHLFSFVGQFPFFSPITIFFTNENENRPCGGFISAVLEVQMMPPKFDFKNIFEFKDFDFGEEKGPLKNVNSRKKIWDAAKKKNVLACSYELKKKYEKITKRKNIFPVLFSTNALEKLIGIYPQFRFQEELLDSDYFFTKISQTVSNIDKNDESSLKNRKNSLRDFAKSFIKKVIFSPFRWNKILKNIDFLISSGDIFIPNKSPSFSNRQIKNSIWVSEWNLGGGKSSRVLEKNLKIDFRENKKGELDGTITFVVTNRGGTNEPLQMTWRGMFEFNFPFPVRRNIPNKIDQINPGESKTYTFHTKIPTSFFRENLLYFFVPRGSQINFDYNLSLIPQQNITAANFLNFTENRAFSFQSLAYGLYNLGISFDDDQSPPFLTYYEQISTKDVPNSCQISSPEFLVEVHVNEKILIDRLQAYLKDRNFNDSKQTEDRSLLNYCLLQNESTLILNFSRKTEQPNERFYLEISGFRDVFQNTFIQKKSTVIERR